MKKYCVKCGHEFDAVGREVICPSCREAAKLEAKRTAVLKAKAKSWSGESVPVRISGRASTVIREYGKAHDVPFAAALDDLLKASAFFQGLGGKWEEVTPYKSRRMKKSTDAEQDAPQDVKQAAQEVTKAASKAVKASKPQTASKAVKTAKTASKTAGKAVK